MLTNLCPACRRVNADDAQNCLVCGADLGEADTVRLPLHPKAQHHSAGALWLDDLVVPPVVPQVVPQIVPNLVPPVGPQIVPHLVPNVESLPQSEIDAEPFSLTLRDLDPPADPPREDTPMTLELVRSDPEAQRPVMAPSRVQPTAKTPSDNPAHTPRPRADRRAAVRHGRHRREPATPRSEPTAAAALVVGAPNPTREALCEMLQAFGFIVHATDNSAEALARAAASSLRVAFVSAEWHSASGDSIENGLNLCSRLRQAEAHIGDSRAVLVLMVKDMRPMDRVRSELAGCDDALSSPITRGSVARLLHARHIHLPADPRRD